MLDAPFDLERTATTRLPILVGGREVTLEARAYRGGEASSQALVLVNGQPWHPDAAEPLVRIHSGCATGDIFHSLRCDCRAQLDAALEAIVAAPLGVLVYLPYQEGRGIGLVDKIRAYALQDRGLDTVDANVEIGHPADAREYGLAARILSDLEFPVIRLMTNNPAKVEALRAHGLEVVEQVPIVVAPGSHNRRYLETKRERLAHKL